MHNHDPHAYTLPVRLLLIVVILFPVGGTWATIYFLAESLPSGRYPEFFFAAPFAIISPLLFVLGTWTLRSLGYRVRKDDVVGGDGRVAFMRSRVGEWNQEVSLPSSSMAFCSTCNKEVKIDDDLRCIHCRWPV